MKLFKNGVGRPSNETKSMRRVFVVSVAAIIISVVALLVSLLSKSSVLTQNLQGAASYSVSYGLYNKNDSDITIRAYPSYRTHNGTVKFPAAPSYSVKSGKNCSFKGWIFQKTDDGRYRYKTKDGKFVWYRSSLDSGKYSISEYAYFEPGETFRLGGIKVKLYAAFNCSSNNSGNPGNTVKNTQKTVASSKSYTLVFSKNSTKATGSMSNQTVSNTGRINANKFSLSESLFSGWKAYRKVNGANKYFVVGKGWVGTSSTATVISDNAYLSSYNIPNHTSNKQTIYLEAQWVHNGGKVNYYTIRYEKNASDATGSMNEQSIKIASNGGTNLNKNKFKRVGYTFSGWKAYRVVNGTTKYFVKGSGWTGSSSNATVIIDGADIQKTYSSGSKYPTYDVDKYTSTATYIYMEAQWTSSVSKSKYYTIKYEKNASAATGSMKDQSIKIASNGGTNLNKNKFKRNGYTFTGWKAYRVVNGTTKYFVKGSGWTGSSSKATIIIDGADIQKTYSSGSKYPTYDVDKYTSTGITINMVAQWKATQWYVNYRVDGNVKKAEWQDNSDEILNVSKLLKSLKGYKAWRYVSGSKRWYVQGSGWTGRTESAASTISHTYKFKDIPGFVNSTGYGNTIYMDAVWK